MRVHLSLVTLTLQFFSLHSCGIFISNVQQFRMDVEKDFWLCQMGWKRVWGCRLVVSAHETVVLCWEGKESLKLTSASSLIVFRVWVPMDISVFILNSQQKMAWLTIPAFSWMCQRWHTFSWFFCLSSVSSFSISCTSYPSSVQSVCIDITQPRILGPLFLSSHSLSSSVSLKLFWTWQYIIDQYT